MQRREFIKSSAAVAGISALPNLGLAKKKNTKRLVRNIIKNIRLKMVR